MLIRSVYVKNVGVLKGPINVELGAGVNIIHGPNECGKTTFLRAIWAGLTMRATTTGKNLEAIKPRDGSTPEVHIVFSHGDTEFKLEKVFAGARGTTRLRETSMGPSRDQSGEAAEARVREVLGLGENKKDTGIWPVVRVEQGEAALPPAQILGGSAREKLTEQLGAITGHVFAGADAQDLFAAVEAEYRRFFTTSGLPARDAEAPLHLAEVELDELRTKQEELQRCRREHLALVDRHASLANDVSVLEQELPLAVDQANALRSTARQIDSVNSEISTATARMETARLLAEQSASWVVERHAARERAAVGQQRLNKVLVDRDVADDRLARHRAQREPLDRDLQTAATLEADLTRALTRYRLHASRLRLALEVRDLERRVQEARVHHGAVAAAHTALAGLSVSDADMARLESLCVALERDELACRALGAAVRVNALVGGIVVVDGVQHHLSVGESIDTVASDRASIKIGEVAEIVVTPGGKELSERRATLEDFRTELARALQALGLESVAQARDLTRDRQLQERNASHGKQLLASVAPEGLSALEVTFGERAESLARTDASLVAVSRADDPVLGEDLRGAELAEITAETAAASARQDADRCREAVARHDVTEQVLRGQLASIEGEIKALQEELREKQALLASLDKEQGDDDVLVRTNEARAQDLRNHLAALTTLRSRLEAMKPANIAAELARAERLTNAMAVELSSKRDEVNRLAGELAGSHVGLDADLAEATARVEQAWDRVSHLQSQAEAARLLYETLASCRADARRRFLDPLRQAIEPMLNVVLGEGDVEFDETFELRGLCRNSMGVDRFETLSAGAQEQVGMIIRLGMARVLAAGGTLPVLVDDSFVNTDRVRFDRAAQVLLRVAQDLQLIVFSCHWERYRLLGVDPRFVVDLERLNVRAA